MHRAAVLHRAAILHAQTAHRRAAARVPQTRAAHAMQHNATHRVLAAQRPMERDRCADLETRRPLPTACLSRGYRYAGTQNDRFGESFPTVHSTRLYTYGVRSYGLYSNGLQGWTTDFIPRLVDDALGCGFVDEVRHVGGSEAGATIPFFLRGPRRRLDVDRVLDPMWTES